MIRLKKYALIVMTALMATSCSDFLDTTPNDALSPTTTWKTQTDAEKFLVGLYDGWEDASALLYWDCASDIGYNNFPWEGFTGIGDGTMSAGNTGWSFYGFGMVRRCNTFLENVDNCEFVDESVRDDMKAQAKFIRAYRYFVMNWNYGGVPLIGNYSSAEEAQVPRNTEAEVRDFIAKELDEAIPMFGTDKGAERGRIGRGAAYALRMREALYYGDYAKAKECAEKVMEMGYTLESDYSNLFKVSGQSSNEVIVAMQRIPNTYTLGTIGQMYNNGDGGWSSIVPTKNLVDMYEMSNGLTKEEAGSGYDETHPFKNRDPRMGMTIIYPGRNYTNARGENAIFNTLDKTINGANNANYYAAADNASKTGLTWAKYLDPITQYANIWKSNACPIVFRYAEVLLTYAEATNELEGPTDKVYEVLNMIRTRAGMPEVDKAKYGTKETLRELIRRERCVELAGEGLRRPDILRWGLAEKVLNGDLLRMVGTVNMDASVPEGERATINPNAAKTDCFIQSRKFNSYNRYLPIPQDALDANPKLEQNPGY